MDRRLRLLTLVGCVAIAFGAGYFVGGGRTAAAETGRPATLPLLGSPAEQLIAKHGAPGKINYAGDIQTWFYPNAEGSLMARYVVNQGLVVQVIGGTAK